jgi:hypothetical protein
MPIRRVVLVLGLLLGAAVGCGGNNGEPTAVEPSGQAPNSAEASTTEPGPAAAATTHEATAEPDQEQGTGNEPKPEGQGPEKPAPKVDRPYAKLATAPVGSNDNSTGPANKRFCVGVSLLRTPPKGLTVKVTGVHLNRNDLIRLLSGTCQGRRSCRSYTFTSENGKCSVVVVPTRVDLEGELPETRLTLSGHAYCAARAQQACAEWVSNADNFDEKFIKLFLPSEPEPEPESTTKEPAAGEGTGG